MLGTLFIQKDVSCGFIYLLTLLLSSGVIGRHLGEGFFMGKRMAIIPSSSCENLIVLMGKVSLLGLRYGSELSSCILSVRGRDYQIVFGKGIETSLCLNDKYIRIVGELKTDKYGDMYIFVTGYRLCNNRGEYAKEMPKWWDISWPKKWSA